MRRLSVKVEIKNTYPWPPREIWPNSRGHWRAKNPVKRKYRDGCFSLTGKVLIPEELKAQFFKITYYFYPPSKRRFDMDNVINACKPLVDGMCSKLEIDDFFANRGEWQRMDVVERGKVEVVLNWNTN